MKNRCRSRWQVVLHTPQAHAGSFAQHVHAFTAGHLGDMGQLTGAMFLTQELSSVVPIFPHQRSQSPARLTPP